MILRILEKFQKHQSSEKRNNLQEDKVLIGLLYLIRVFPLEFNNC